MHLSINFFIQLHECICLIFFSAKQLRRSRKTIVYSLRKTARLLETTSKNPMFQQYRRLLCKVGKIPISIISNLLKISYKIHNTIINHFELVSLIVLLEIQKANQPRVNMEQNQNVRRGGGGGGGCITHRSRAP